MEAFTSEKIRKPISGYPIVLFMIVFALLCFLVSAGTGTAGWLGITGVVLVILGKGLVVINPNSSNLLLLFGAYRGSIRESGLF